MRCEQVRDTLGAYADDEVAGAHRARLEDHIRACEGCRAELAALRSLGTLIAGLPVPAPPEGIEASILDAALRSTLRPHRTNPLWSGIMRTAAALLVALAGAYFGMRASVLLPASSPLADDSLAAGPAEALYAASFELLPPDSPGARALALFQEEGR